MADFMDMPASREMDVIVAEKVMGWERSFTALNNRQRVVVPPSGNPHYAAWWLGKSIYHMVPCYAIDIADAWKVHEKMLHSKYINKYCGILDVDELYCDAEEAALRICRAALKTVLG